MNSETPLDQAATNAPVQTCRPSPSIPSKTTRFYRPIDWRAFLLVTALAFIGYFLTLAPDVTLQDSGEEAVASMYAGVPHPPGYPFWTLLTWCFTKLVPFSNIAWRVALASAVTASLACGFLALMISRGSSLLIESIGELKEIDQRLANALCLGAAFSGSMLFGYNGFLWSQAVIVEVYPLSVLSLMLTLCLILRWMHAPEQRPYLYSAALLFGIGITNHQTLLVAAMGIEIAVIAAHPKLGRDLLAFNCLGWLLGLFANANHLISSFDSIGGRVNMVWVIFNIVGVLSLAGLVWLTLKTKAILTEWKAVLLLIAMWTLGVAFYFYMPIASMTNPPMNWGYARAVDGFFHVISRGQYERISPTDFIHDPARLIQQVFMLIDGAGEEFTYVFLLLALVPFAFFFRMQKREQAWMAGLFGIFLCMAGLLMVLLNPSLDRASHDLNKVFFTNSYVPLAMWIGYGLALSGAWLVTHYQRIRFWALCGGGVVTAVAIWELIEKIKDTFSIAESDSFGGVQVLSYGFSHLIERGLGSLPIWGSLVVLACALGFLVVILVCKERVRAGLILAIFAAMPAASWISHWADNEQRGHLFGFWYGHDMFTPPFVYPEMARDAVLFGGTDAGRFCPTYMIFCESFIPPEKRRDPAFDRRDVCLITQNALADRNYLDYIRAHYNRSEQRDLPFFQNFLPTVFPKLFSAPTPGMAWLDDAFLRLGAKIEKERRASTSFFRETDFIDLPAFTEKLRRKDDNLSRFIAGKLSRQTQDLLAAKSDEKIIRRALVKDFNAILESGSIFSEERFQSVKLPALIDHAVRLNQLPNTIIRLNRRLLEEAYFGLIARSPGGVFPDTEIHTPSVAELSKSYDAYMSDAARRLEHDRKFPNEPRQVRSFEDISLGADSRVQIQGQVAIMSVNGLLTKIIFDENPDRQFYVEESIPMDWMYPYLTPFGVIMKINRQPLPELTQEMADKDHKFWSLYSDRLIGNWITYDTPIADICAFAENIYAHRDYRDFKGDLKFVRDNDAQKSFSKLRSAIGGVYAWRAEHSANTGEQHRMQKEAEFAFKQAFAYCPYSVEMLRQFANLLLSMGRTGDALLVARTCQKLDPFNEAILSVIGQLENNNQAPPALKPLLLRLQSQVGAGQTNEIFQTLDQILNSPDADLRTINGVATLSLQLHNLAEAEAALKKITDLSPLAYETWYDLASLRAAQGKKQDARDALKKALALCENQRKQNPSIPSLYEHYKLDPNFNSLRQTPEFQSLFQK